MNIKENHLKQWDCLKVLKEMRDNCIDLTITSPPYDNLRTYNWYSWDFEWIAKELYRVTKDWGVVVWVVGDQTIKWSESWTSFKQALYFKEIGFNLHDTMIYSKSVPPMNDRRYQHCFEYMFVLSKGIPKTFNPIMEEKKYKDTRKVKNFHRYANATYAEGFSKPETNLKIKESIWRIFAAGGSSDKIASKHPAIFPEKLAEDHILSWSNPWDIVLDCFAWSGTTLKMAAKNYRYYVWIEISEEYIEIIKKRLSL